MTHTHSEEKKKLAAPGYCALESKAGNKARQRHYFGITVASGIKRAMIH